tara:strand:+ start:3467 stop:3676 length:210 start_codon:yes stop_codon:yes gene_type:complete
MKFIVVMDIDPDDIILTSNQLFGSTSGANVEDQLDRVLNDAEFFTEIVIAEDGITPNDKELGAQIRKHL